MQPTSWTGRRVTFTSRNWPTEPRGVVTVMTNTDNVCKLDISGDPSNHTNDRQSAPAVTCIDNPALNTVWESPPSSMIPDEPLPHPNEHNEHEDNVNRNSTITLGDLHRDPLAHHGPSVLIQLGPTVPNTISDPYTLILAAIPACAVLGSILIFMNKQDRAAIVVICSTVGLSTPILSKIPMPVLYEVFLYMDVASLNGLQFFDRILPVLITVHRNFKVKKTIGLE